MMKFINIKSKLAKVAIVVLVSTSIVACVREELPLPDAPFPSTAEIFTDTFINMGSNFYFPFVGDGAKPDVFSVDDSEGFESTASIRIDVPDANDPGGGFAGATFEVDGAPRDLTSYNALTFYAKASQSATLGTVGFGFTYLATRTNLQLTTKWTKFIIPIPDPSKLEAVKTVFLFAAGGIGDVPGEEKGYTFWIDELKYENLSTIAQPIFLPLERKVIFNVDGTDIEVNASAAYFEEGNIDPAPTPPARDASEVVSIFSDAYENVQVDNYNGFFEFATTQGGLLTLGGQNIISYTDLNFVSINMYQSPDVDVSAMTHFHVDINVQEQLDDGDFLRLEIINNDGPGSSSGSVDLGGITPLQSDQWVSYDIPICEFAGLSATNDIDLIFFVSDATISNILVDNVYFYYEDGGEEACGTPGVPPTEAPATPTQDAANVVSIYSDTYDDVPNDGFNLYGSAAFAEVNLGGNSVLQYTNSGSAGGNFQVIELGANNFDGSDLTNFRFDAWFSNEIPDGGYFIIKVVDFTNSPSVEAVVTINADSSPAIVQGQWLSYDFSMADLESLGLSSKSTIQQIVIDVGTTGEVYIDNIYFYK